MTCKHIREILLTDYLDNELSEVQEQELTEHLNSCNDCQTYKSSLISTIVEPLGKIETEDVPLSILENIKKEIKNGTMHVNKRHDSTVLNFVKYLHPLRIAAAIILFGIVFLMLDKPESTPPTTVKLTESQKEDVMVFLTDQYMEFNDESMDDDLFLDESYL